MKLLMSETNTYYFKKINKYNKNIYVIRYIFSLFRPNQH